MPNKYSYNYTLDELIEEEDREVRNDLMRTQMKYYDTLNQINNIILSSLKDMSNDEVKEIIKNNGPRIPVVRL